MGVYTLKISGEPIDDARSVLEAAGGIHVRSEAGSGAIVVTADAPSAEEAEETVRGVLPQGGSYSIGRPAALEDEED
jgi:hypothetical protein